MEAPQPPASSRRTAWRRAAGWALRHVLLPMRWFAAGWAPMPCTDGSEWDPPAPSVRTGPPAGHPERSMAGVPPTPVERELWARLAEPI
ncbi:DUF6059 family protein [Kitasatospora sp. NPDC059463]|uniref:DUF6059 family protein n=1 Tax=unclassified Kitasatospora TaxID=2633591 RepID=UPI00368EA3F8